MEIFHSHSAFETFEFGKKFGQQLTGSVVICLFGELAAGKTTFVKGLVNGFTHLDPSHVQSPTFSILNIYEGDQTVYHFDLYRLKNIDQFLSMGFDEYFEIEGTCSVVEWSERISAYLPKNSISITFEHAGEDARIITIKTSL